MGRGVARQNAGNGIGEEPAAGVALETDAAGDAGEPGGERGVEGVGQDDSEVEVVVGKRTANAPFFSEIAGAALGVPGDEVVAEGFAAIEVGHPGHGEESNASVGEAFAESAQGGQRHDGVTDPVGGADENALVAVGQKTSY